MRAWRLGPEGQTFLTPVQLVIAYGDDDVNGSAPEVLEIGFQNTDGTWSVLNDFTLDATANNVGMTWRKLNAPPIAPAITGIDTAYANSPIGYTVTSGTMNADGSAMVSISAALVDPGANVISDVTCILSDIGCRVATVQVPMALVGDHDVFNPNNSTTNWFFRNKWHEVVLYAVAPNITPSGTRSCTDGASCLLVRNVDDNLSTLNGRARPRSSIST